ncbi:MAG: GNAT family N-acetyltransferase [Candidatus Eremiobacteraeota bacterium]|nr:GNAT family N-acetyltransferase [Candidatus Eremiobacteraeota bacterium]
MSTKLMEPADANAWAAMRNLLWPDQDRSDLAAEVAAYFEGCNKFIEASFIVRDASGLPAGFLELGLRPYAEGCVSSPVPHVEGWFVLASARGRGLGRNLMAAAESWARDHGYAELTSDGLLGNDLGFRAHLAVGFDEVERLIAFRKAL